MEGDKRQNESEISCSASTDSPGQNRVWLNINFEELDQFTSPNIVCQYCFRLIGLDKSIESLVSELRRKPLITPSTPLEPLWASEKFSSKNQSLQADFSSRPPPTAYPPRLNNSSTSSKPSTRTFSDDDPLTTSTSSKFSSALPSTPSTTSSASQSPNLIASRKNHILVTPPALALQPRRPKMRITLSPHEPYALESANGSSKRQLATPTSSSSNSKLSSSGSQKFGFYEILPETSSSPSQKPKLEDNNMFGLNGSTNDDNTTSEGLTDEQLFRELVAHTVAEYDLDFPICCECAPSYYNSIQLEVEDADHEIDYMEEFLLNFPDSTVIDRELARLDGEIELFQKQCEDITLEFDHLVIKTALEQKSNEICDSRTEELNVLKEDYWNRYYRHRHEDLCQRDVYETVLARLSGKTKFLEHLRTSCGLNDAFHMSFQGHYAAINGLRLGLKSPTLKSTVDWDEISAASGFLLFLFVKVGTALNYNWQTSKYRIRVDGSFSTILNTKDNTSYSLFVDKEGGWSLLRFRDQNSFDRAFDIFVQVFVEVTLGVPKKLPHFNMPFPVTLNPITIAGRPLQSSRSNPEVWTHQVKQMVINIKSLLSCLVANGNVK